MLYYYELLFSKLSCINHLNLYKLFLFYYIVT